MTYADPLPLGWSAVMVWCAGCKRASEYRWRGPSDAMGPLPTCWVEGCGLLMTVMPGNAPGSAVAS